MPRLPRLPEASHRWPLTDSAARMGATVGVVITGMHRSGTSMLGQWVAGMGLGAGDGPELDHTSANPTVV